MDSILQTFTGNTDRETLVKNALDIPVQAKKIRFIPTAYSQGGKALRVELYGQPVDGNHSSNLYCGVL